jgi:predicted AAA+ superfamily ATPase
MAISNFDRVTKVMELLRSGLGPFVEREIVNKYKIKAEDIGTRLVPKDGINAKKPPREWDVSALLIVIGDTWNEIFRDTLGFSDRNLVSELRTIRNQWAHQEPFNFDDTYRALDSAERLLTSISAVAEAQEISRSKSELMRLHFEEQSRNVRRKLTTVNIESQGSMLLKPWRTVVEPHEDVARGSYQNAEFAADLWQVFVGEGSSEYQDPIEFFRRTHLTQSLRGLLKGAMLRVSGKGGDPVIQLQTNFGGGKTHSMLALYHLLSSQDTTSLLGVEELMKEAEISKLPEVKRVVLVGTKLSPSTPSIKPDGTVVHTLWGELAYQLGGPEAYSIIAKDDENATSPGDALRKLMNEYGPCLILIDEWVAYARQLHDEFDLPGGNFDTQFTFAQALTESASGSNSCLLVVSLPASDTGSSLNSEKEDNEVGGERGRAALERLRNAVGRVEATWRPASAEESFEIVRRRLFNPLIEREQFVARDVVANSFSKLYIDNKEDFPAECKTADYEKAIRDAYPIHPEVFERLYSDWSTLAKFQRTRGVLRLMATVIHSLWSSEDSSPLILPAHLPMDDSRVRSELTRYLPDNWSPIIDKDIDGPNSLPVSIDTQNPELGKYHACRRVTRTIYLGSAATSKAANKGLDLRRIKLGCVMPGEPAAKFNDALRRLASSATYLYNDDARYWFDTQPTVTKIVEDRAEQFTSNPDKATNELRKRLNANCGSSEFAAIHKLPPTAGDIPDDIVTRLVILGPNEPYIKDPNEKSPAEKRTIEILESRGNAPRRYRNTLVFLAADAARYQELDLAIRIFLAWESVIDDKDSLDLTMNQIRQAETQKSAAHQRVDAQLSEAYQWLLVPVQANPSEPVKIDVLKLTGQGNLDSRAAKKLQNEERLLTSLGGNRLLMEIDRIPLWQNEEKSVAISQLVEYFASYTYLPRVASPNVIYRAIEAGVRLLTWRNDGFAYAESYDNQKDRFIGLSAGTDMAIQNGDRGLVVKSTIADKQLKVDLSQVKDASSIVADETDEHAPQTPVSEQGTVSIKARPRRYHASIDLDPQKPSDVSKIYNEVISHFTSASLFGITVKVSLEIEADNEEGFGDNIVRIVSENGNSLKFKQHGFEES